MFARLLAFAIALLLGVSFWPALLLYSGVGACVIFAAAATHIIVGRLFAKPSMQTAYRDAKIDLHRPFFKSKPTRLRLPHLVPHEAKKILAVDDDPSLLE